MLQDAPEKGLEHSGDRSEPLKPTFEESLRAQGGNHLLRAMNKFLNKIKLWPGRCSSVG